MLSASLQRSDLNRIQRYCILRGDRAFNENRRKIAFKALVPVMIPRRFDQKQQDCLDLSLKKMFMFCFSFDSRGIIFLVIVYRKERPQNVRAQGDQGPNNMLKHDNSKNDENQN